MNGDVGTWSSTGSSPPERRPVARRHVLTVVAYPIVWVVVTLLRGPTAYDPDLATIFSYAYPF